MSLCVFHRVSIHNISSDKCWSNYPSVAINKISLNFDQNYTLVMPNSINYFMNHVSTFVSVLVHHWLVIADKNEIRVYVSIACVGLYNPYNNGYNCVELCTPHVNATNRYVAQNQHCKRHEFVYHRARNFNGWQLTGPGPISVSLIINVFVSFYIVFISNRNTHLKCVSRFGGEWSADDNKFTLRRIYTIYLPSFPFNVTQQHT